MLEGEAVLDLAPSYRLEPMAATLFGGERIASYDFTFAETDRKLLALEQFELAACVRNGTTPEVDARQGLHALAVVMSLFESQVSGRAVTVDEVATGALGEYQHEIDEYYGLTGVDCTMKLSYSTWGMPTVPIAIAVRHCAELGFDGLELTVIPGWSTDAAGLTSGGSARDPDPLRQLQSGSVRLFRETSICLATIGRTPSGPRSAHTWSWLPNCRDRASG